MNATNAEETMEYTENGKRPITTVTKRPTEQMPSGVYKVVDSKGLYWGHWYVGQNWCGERFVAHADPRDGAPY